MHREKEAKRKNTMSGDWTGILALIGVVITNIFNYFGRKKRDTIETKKIEAAVKKVALEKSSFIEDKYRLYQEIMQKISRVTEIIQGVYEKLDIKNEALNSNVLREACKEEKISELLDAIVQLVRSNQVVVPRNIHTEITRKYCKNVKKLLTKIANLLDEGEGVSDSSAITELSNITNEIIGFNDKIKRLLAEDIGATF